MRERHDPKFGVRNSESLELRTSSPRVSLVPPVSHILCGSERLETFRKTKILAVIHRAINHGRLSARECGVQHRPQFRRSLHAVAGRAKTLRQGDEVGVTEF